jgi:hypothetical protein
MTDPVITLAKKILAAQKLREEAAMAANIVSSGKIAGADENPPVKKRRKLLRRKEIGNGRT